MTLFLKKIITNNLLVLAFLLGYTEKYENHTFRMSYSGAYREHRMLQNYFQMGYTMVQIVMK